MRVREAGAAQGMALSSIEALATAATEIARNMLVHARGGELSVEAVDRQRGVVVIARDRGPGIPELALAMQDGYTTGDGLGLGLPSAKRLVDALEIVSEPGRGTTVTLTKWVP
jgi:serine/threonine-protein kinase RsbT